MNFMKCFILPLKSSPLLQVFFGFFFGGGRVLAVLCGMWDLSSPARDQTGATCIGSTVSIA